MGRGDRASRSKSVGFILEGIYPAADDSITIQDDFDSNDLNKNKNSSSFIPWNKRCSFIEATYTEEEPPTTFVRTSSRRNSFGRFSSIRRSKISLSGEDSSSQKGSKKTSFRRMNSLDRDTIRSNRSTASTLRRNHSESSSTYKKRRMMSSLSKHNMSMDYASMHKDMPKTLKLRKSNRYKIGGIGAQSFFDRYQDNLRVEIFSFQSSTSSPPVDEASPTTPISYDENSSVFDYNEESLSKEFDYKLVGKTYQQLFYIRSRLSATAKKTEFRCDGSYGCSSDVHCSTPQWV